MKYLALVPGFFLGMIIAHGIALAQAVPPVQLRPGDNIGWDHPGLDLTGQPEVLASFELAATLPSTTDPSQPGVILATITRPDGIVNAPWPTPIDTLVAAGQLQPGFYKLWSRATDSGGNAGPWSPPFDVELPRVFWDKTPPAAPSVPRKLP
jgi:hypothetical protein